MILLIVFLIVIVAVGAIALFWPGAGMLAPPARQSEPARGAGAATYPRAPVSEPRIPRLRDFPPGCLVGIIAASLVWFGLWTLVLIFALRFLSTPYSG